MAWPHPGASVRPSTGRARERWPRRCGSSSSSSPGISSMICPRDITSTRSHRPASSRGSLDLTSRAAPASVRERSACVDVEPGTDVDALRGLVGQDHRRLPEERTRDRDLLLVTAGEELDGLLERRRADLEPLDQFLDRRALPAPAQEPEHAEPAQRLDRGVDPHAEHRHQRLALAVARQQHDPRSHRLVRRDQHQLLAVADHATRPSAAGGPPGSRRAGAGRCPPRRRSRRSRRVCRVKLTGPKDWPCRPSTTSTSSAPRRSRARRRERRLERPADDQLDQLRFAGRGGVERPLVAAVAQHGDPIGDLEHLGQAVAHVHDADTATLARRDRAVQRLDLVRARARSWARRAAAPWARSRAPWPPRTAAARPA